MLVPALDVAHLSDVRPSEFAIGKMDTCDYFVCYLSICGNNYRDFSYILPCLG